MNFSEIPCPKGGFHTFDPLAPEKRCFKCDRVLIIPQPIQIKFLKSPAHVVIFGGAKGCSKSFSLLLATIRHIDNPRFGAVVFRRESTQIFGQGGLWDTSQMIYPHVGGEAFRYRSEWLFPSGAKIKFAHLAMEKDVNAWDGQQVPLICFDELTLFTLKQFWYMLTINRSTCGVEPRMMATCNPDSDSWVADLISWWIDQDTGLPIPERGGKLRWFVREGGELVWGNSREELLKQFPRQLPKSLTFIPAKLEDNPILERADPGYRANLLSQETVTKQRLLDGNWKVRPAAGLKFPRDKWRKYAAPPNDLRLVRFWDKACLVAGTMIETAIGPRPIEQIEPGDMVLTRRGYRRVKWSGCTGFAERLTETQFSNGSVLVGTGDHLVWTENRKWISLDTLRGFDVCLALGGEAWRGEGGGGYRTQRRSSSTVLSTAGVLGSGTSGATGTAKRNLCTETSGDSTTGKSRQDTTYTTTTRTGTITTRPISCVFHMPSIFAATGTAGRHQNNASGPEWLALQQRIGVAGMQAHDDTRKSTAIEVSRHGQTLQRGQRHASNATRSLSIGGLAGGPFDFAAEHARIERGPFGERSSVPVFDLIIEGEHEFFANGILVHNSTEGGKGARTAGILMGDLGEARARESGLPQFWVVHGEVDRWGDAEREAKIKSLAALDQQVYGHVTVGMEREGGSGGKHSAFVTVTNLAGFDVYSEPATTNKAARWTPLATQQQVGNVAIVCDNTWDWAGFIRELDALAGDAELDKAKLKDQADAASGAFKYLAPGGGGATVQGEIIASDEDDTPLTAEDKAGMPDFLRELIGEADGTQDDSLDMPWVRD